MLFFPFFVSPTLLRLQVSTAMIFMLCTASAQNQAVKVIVAPNHTDWTYRVNQDADFSIAVLKNGNPLPGVHISYEIGPERMTPTKTDSLTLPTGRTTINGGTLGIPGFLRCIVTTTVDGFTYRGLATAGFNAADIKPTVQLPADFDAFWAKAKAELAKIPLDTRMRLMADKCTGTVDVFEVSMLNIGKSRFYGIVCIPKKEGKYPAVLMPPGAGVSAYNGEVALAERGLITLRIGVHGIPVTMDPELYKNLSDGALKNYPSIQLDDKNNYYYKRIYLGCVRANDFLTSLPQYDGTNLAVFGSSQGGALSIVTAALDSRVKVLGAIHPALCDLTGFLHGRAGGWPQFFNPSYGPVVNVKDKVETIGYYDVVNFAKALKVEGLYSWGYNDEVCPPTSLYSAYNSITAPKILFLSLDTGHNAYPETYNKYYDWLCEKLKGTESK